MDGPEPGLEQQQPVSPRPFLFQKFSWKLITFLVIVSAVVSTSIIYSLSKPKTSNLTSTSNQQVQFTEGQEVTLKGTVIKNNTENLAVDGPATLSIQTDKGIVKVIYHPAEAPCTNTQARDFGLTIQTGDNVEVFGKFSDGAIQTCDSTTYYIKKPTSFLDQENDDLKRFGGRAGPTTPVDPKAKTVTGIPSISPSYPQDDN